MLVYRVGHRFGERAIRGGRQKDGLLDIKANLPRAKPFYESQRQAPASTISLVALFWGHRARGGSAVTRLGDLLRSTRWVLRSRAAVRVCLEAGQPARLHGPGSLRCAPPRHREEGRGWGSGGGNWGLWSRPRRVTSGLSPGRFGRSSVAHEVFAWLCHHCSIGTSSASRVLQVVKAGGFDSGSRSVTAFYPCQPSVVGHPYTLCVVRRASEANQGGWSEPISPTPPCGQPGL